MRNSFLPVLRTTAEMGLHVCVLCRFCRHRRGNTANKRRVSNPTGAARTCHHCIFFLAVLSCLLVFIKCRRRRVHCSKCTGRTQNKPENERGLTGKGDYPPTLHYPGRISPGATQAAPQIWSIPRTGEHPYNKTLIQYTCIQQKNNEGASRRASVSQVFLS